jgi:hypothetical protein
MAKLVIDRALKGNVANSWPRWEEMLGIGAASGFTAAPAVTKASASAPTKSTPARGIGAKSE